MARSMFLQAFYPPPHVSAEEELLHLLCPVRALGIYLERSFSWRTLDQLLMCFGSPTVRRGSLHPNKALVIGLIRLLPQLTRCAICLLCIFCCLQSSLKLTFKLIICIVLDLWVSTPLS